MSMTSASLKMKVTQQPKLDDHATSAISPCNLSHISVQLIKENEEKSKLLQTN